MPDPAPVHITTRSGAVRVEAVANQSELAVQGGIVEQQADGSFRIHRAPSASTIQVRCAPGTDVTVGTTSGKIELTGPLGAVRVVSVSGKIHVGEATQLDVRATSGKIEIGTCAGECRIMTKSATVRVGQAGRATVAAISGFVLLERVSGAEIKTVSGKVSLGSAGTEPVSVRSVSGTVEVRVLGPFRPATRLKSLSGRIQNDIAPGDDFEIAVSSVSGTIKVFGS